MPIHDVLIIGGGPGGLAVATGLARQLYTAVVFDSGVYRNARTSHMHNVPTWDHRNPADFRSKARSDLLARYETITFEETNVESLRRNSEGRFEAKDARGATWTGKKIVLASGMRDVYPEIQGYDDVWGRGVYHCLFCDGFEDRNSASAGVLAVEDVAKAPVALHLARMAKRLARKVTIYTNGASELKDQIVTSLGKDPIIELDDRRVIRLEKVREGTSETILHLEDGTSISQVFVVHKPKTQVNGPFVEQLQLELTEAGAIKTSQPFYETTVQGVFAVGDCASTMPAVVNALAMGAFAAGGLVAQLGAEPTP
ncbi:Thioredoxin reductase gliT [Colletotrichum fructicola]|uniref:Thioredoxin reductase n=1 Tax=Colletotrichum fructicola (strain Nara gc5) TaxID=1213859 RepID=L2FNG9_COLFN|nr:Thioredoxin reductase [Colletotrichum fructicola]KAF4483855.1 Thioredoxin reductase gliT [Colletotrichum fructicola Nara gc5]KAE9572552.1 Thioredoxin reductase [Colletotrichum fructicola]KAF4416617.1 Thioredoxin reductase gliT [Colletotrichum fructicola]KAF4893466.1 Thioredoxin reductase gliT [Colletotrichum fructicola]KAF4904586.1 Thioredoxin reductase gliT [Colletotrichum fructicola]